ncbi:MAG: hypothetical protein HZB81_01765 [Deltaproteobacteria bacterium]|nr:hypothetical protein [Deltaproteobacteria bacterium]
MSFSPQDSAFSKALEAISTLKSGERCAISGFLGSSKAFFIASLLGKGVMPYTPTPNSEIRTALIITPTQEEAENFTKDINFFLGENAALLYPSWEILPFEAQSPHPDIVAARIDILYKLAHGHRNIIVTTASAILQKVMPKDILTPHIPLTPPLSPSLIKEGEGGVERGVLRFEVGQWLRKGVRCGLPAE